MAVDDDGFAANYRKHVAFRANGHTPTAAYAVVGVDFRMLRLGSPGKVRPFFRCGASQDLALHVGAPVAKKEESKDNTRNQPGDKCFHSLPEPQTHEPKAHNNHNVQYRKYGERIAERAMNHMPEVEDALSLIQKHYASGECCFLPDQPDNVLDFPVSA
jgi:hypothetical protein